MVRNFAGSVSCALLTLASAPHRWVGDSTPEGLLRLLGGAPPALAANSHIPPFVSVFNDQLRAAIHPNACCPASLAKHPFIARPTRQNAKK